MAIQVVKIRTDDFHRVYDPLLRRLNPRFELSRWQRLFEWGWENPEDHVGFALEAESRHLVGFLATIYSVQKLNEKGFVTVCNVSSWVVDPGFRSSALALVMPVLRRPDLTVTNLTSLPEVNDMFRKLGFATLETHTRVLLPLPAPSQAPSLDCERIDPAEATSIADPRIASVIQDHAKVDQQWLLRGDTGTCHVVLTLGRRRRLRTARIHHISDPEIFSRGIWSFRGRLFKDYGTVLCEWDERLLGGLEVPRTRRVPLPVSRIFRSKNVRACELSNLYSELPLLNL